MLRIQALIPVKPVSVCSGKQSTGALVGFPIKRVVGFLISKHDQLFIFVEDRHETYLPTFRSPS